MKDFAYKSSEGASLPPKDSPFAFCLSFQALRKSFPPPLDAPRFFNVTFSLRDGGAGEEETIFPP